MTGFSTPAIMLRRVDFGDYDLIVTFLTRDKGKLSVIAKSAKKSVKRFSGVLELFSVLNIVCGRPRRGGMPVLQEATLRRPFSRIRHDVKKTAYASYWAELINRWLEDHDAQDELFVLFMHVLDVLDAGSVAEEALSVMFQMRFLAISGHCPSLDHCGCCNCGLETLAQNRVFFDVKNGRIACPRCANGAGGRVTLSKGTIKQLLWLLKTDVNKAGRIRFTAPSLAEGLSFVESFVPYHLGITPRSLTFLKQIR